MRSIAHLRREALQLRHEADLIRADGAVDEAAVLDERAAEIEARIDSTDGEPA